MMRDNLLRILVGALVLAGVVWFVHATEWREIEVPTEAKGEAVHNPFYAAQKLLRELGVRTDWRAHLGEMPPPEATLLLNSSGWNFLDGRAQALERWVHAGGHLVLFDANDRDIQAWSPVSPKPRQRKPAAEADSDDANPDDESPDGENDEDGCRPWREPDSLRPFFGDDTMARTYRVCRAWGARDLAARVPLWALSDGEATPVLRAAHGRGTVTVLTAGLLFDNHNAMRHDHPALLAAALQARPGHTVWFVTEESRSPLPVWLWQQAGVAIVLGALAVLAAVWRMRLRFGPRVRPTAPGRRSMREQITGTAQFLSRAGADDLYAAQLQALHDAAQSRLRGYAEMPRADRAVAMAQATGLDAGELGRALDRSIPRRPQDLPPVLQLLETARRLLVQSTRH